MAKWQRMHPTPYDDIISKAVYHKLFEAVGEDEKLQQNYFERRARVCKSGDVLAYDLTTVSTYSENLNFARQGYNKDHDVNDTVKLLTIYSLKTRQPILLLRLVVELVLTRPQLPLLRFLPIESVGLQPKRPSWSN